MFKNCAFDGIIGLKFINYFMSVINLAHGILILTKQKKLTRHHIVCGDNVKNNSIPVGFMLIQNTIGLYLKVL